jgi:hypothetical protein
MPYDLDCVPEGNTNRPEVKDHVDVKKQSSIVLLWSLKV